MSATSASSELAWQRLTSQQVCSRQELDDRGGAHGAAVGAWRLTGTNPIPLSIVAARPLVAARLHPAIPRLPSPLCLHLIVSDLVPPRWSCFDAFSSIIYQQHSPLLQHCFATSSPPLQHSHRSSPLFGTSIPSQPPGLLLLSLWPSLRFENRLLDVNCFPTAGRAAAADGDKAGSADRLNCAQTASPSPFLNLQLSLCLTVYLSPRSAPFSLHTNWLWGSRGQGLRSAIQRICGSDGVDIQFALAPLLPKVSSPAWGGLQR